MECVCVCVCGYINLELVIKLKKVIKKARHPKDLLKGELVSRRKL